MRSGIRDDGAGDHVERSGKRARGEDRGGSGEAPGGVRLGGIEKAVGRRGIDHAAKGVHAGIVDGGGRRKGHLGSRGLGSFGDRLKRRRGGSGKGGVEKDGGGVEGDAERASRLSARKR